MKKKNKLLSAITCLSVFSTAIIGTTSTSYASEVEPVEITTMRSEYEKHFDNGDGTITAFVNTAPLHFENNGQWEEIDNTLMVDENGDYVNKNNPMKVSIENQACLKNTSEITDDQIVEIEYKGYTLSWDIVDVNDKKNNSNKAKKSSDIKIKKNKNSNNGKSKLSKETDEIMNKISTGAVYDSFDENMNLSVDITPQSVKDTVTLIEPDPTLTEVTYFIQAKKLTPKLYEDGSVDFFDKNNDVIFNIPPAFMFDSSENPEYNFKIETELTKYKNGYLLTLTPDYEWLNSSERVYPVMIDPEVTLNSGFTGAYIDEQYPNNSYSNSFLKLRRVYNQNIDQEVLLTFPEDFSNYSPNMEIINAECNIYILTRANCSSETPAKIAPSALLKNVDMNNATWENIHNSPNKMFSGDYSSIELPKETTNQHNQKYYTFNITGVAQTWLNHAKTSQIIGTQNYGLRLSICQYFDTLVMLSPKCSTNKPYYTITYTLRNPYVLNYAPEKYNDIGNSVKNFQRRMNCYAYALQVYYNGNLAEDEYYNLLPGEFGLLYNSTSDSYSQLLDQYKSDILLSKYTNFIEARIREDAKVLGFGIEPFEVSEDAFSLPNNFVPTQERIIGLVTKEYNNSIEYHFYVRNGNGTCSEHGGTCSMWSHKRGTNPVTNKSISGNVTLCDYNIANHICDYYYMFPKYYTITQDITIYDSWYGDGRDSTNNMGTPYRP